MRDRHPSAAQRRTRAAVALAGASTVLISLFPAARAIATFDLTRLAGADRYATGATVATGSFTSADTVVVATGTNFPDALAGNYIAGQSGSPILLTQKDVVPAATQAAIAALNPSTIVILGGTDAIAAGGVPTGAEVRRIDGATRYATAVAAAEAGATIASIGGVKTAIVASGENFPDALAAGPAAWANGLPLLLTPKSSLDAGTRAFLADKSIGKVILMGGTAAIEESVATSIRTVNAATPLVVDRIAGADRTETARLFAEYSVAQLGFRSDGIDVARGDLYPDALAGGPHAGNDKQPILLTASPTVASNSVGTGVIKYATDHSNALAGGHVLGGTGAVSTATELEIEAAARGARSNATFSVSGDREERELGAAGARTCTVPILSDGVFDARLFPSENVIVATDGTVTFVDSNGDHIADESAVGANIVQVNGVTVVPSGEQNDVAATGSLATLSFTIQGTAPDDVTLVVWQDEPTLTTQALDLRSPSTASTSSAPSEKFGFGCRTAFTNEAPSGSIAPVVVTAVDKDNDSFATANATYFYDANDVFTVDDVPVGLAAFEAALSPGDVIAGTYARDSAAVGAFHLTDAAPVVPAALTATQATTTPTSSIVLSWPDSATATNDAYNIYRVASDPGSTCPDFNEPGTTGRGRFVGIAAVTDMSTTTTYTYADTSLAPDTPYCYAVTAVDQGDESTTGATASAATAAAVPTTVPGAPTSTSATFQDVADSGAGVFSPGDVLTLVFNEVMSAPAAGDSITLTDGDTTQGTLTDSVNATFALVTTGLNANRAITVTVTGPPAISGAGMTAGLQYGSSTVTASNGNTDSDEGLEWNLGGSADKTF